MRYFSPFLSCFPWRLKRKEVESYRSRTLLSSPSFPPPFSASRRIFNVRQILGVLFFLLPPFLPPYLAVVFVLSRRGRFFSLSPPPPPLFFSPLRCELVMMTPSGRMMTRAFTRASVSFSPFADLERNGRGRTAQKRPFFPPLSFLLFFFFLFSP